MIYFRRIYRKLYKTFCNISSYVINHETTWCLSQYMLMVNKIWLIFENSFVKEACFKNIVIKIVDIFL